MNIKPIFINLRHSKYMCESCQSMLLCNLKRFSFIPHRADELYVDGCKKAYVAYKKLSESVNIKTRIKKGLQLIQRQLDAKLMKWKCEYIAKNSTEFYQVMTKLKHFSINQVPNDNLSKFIKVDSSVSRFIEEYQKKLYDTLGYNQCNNNNVNIDKLTSDMKLCCNCHFIVNEEFTQEEVVLPAANNDELHHSVTHLAELFKYYFVLPKCTSWSNMYM